MSRRSVRVGLLLASVIAVAAGVYFAIPGRTPSPVGPKPLPDPRLAYSGPYKNIRPDVKFVGDAVCNSCHDQCKTYAMHPMGRSLRAIKDDTLPPLDTAHHNPFPAIGAMFRVEKKGDRVWQCEYQNDDSGKPIFENALEVQYVMGSGNHGYSYLTDRGGYVCQTPISWYSSKHIWDLAPGWTTVGAGRPVLNGCLFCHCNEVKPMDGYVNRYEEPLFRGTNIGCERCHGPGELHAATASKKDYSIVNPKDLPPPLREAVCQQCHLEGEYRLLRRGRGLFDFRPGMPVSDFWSIAVHAANEDDAKAVNHVEQMAQSRCFRGGAGANQMGCISCHDPHVKVTAAERTAHFRGRCLNCHQSHGCSVPEAERRKTSRDDSCIDCHMTRFASSDIAHTASTDHRILRKPLALKADPNAGTESERRVPVRLFHKPADEALDPEETRDLAIILAMLARDGKAHPRHAAGAAERLTEFLRDNPNDVEAWEGKAVALLSVKRLGDAGSALEAALAINPKRESVLATAAMLAQLRGRSDEAVGYWSRAAELNPWREQYHANLTKLLAAKGDWAGVKRHGRTWLDLDPGDVEARKYWIEYLWKSSDAVGAKAEFAKIEAMKPKDLNELRKWFEGGGNAP